ncbi:uncharacterized protein LOC119993005 isoform X2 [Tripterygium wilfordii]|nr:uncharacterized protein LOC119993005 isoform X2 [Tripterygium wilfordii]
MDYTIKRQHDSDGIHGHIRMQNAVGTLCARGYGIGRMPSVAEFSGNDGMDLKFEVHSLEKEAYGSVLRAFIAQSDLLSWGKEGLLSELRKELNVDDIEHGELLLKINSDESIKMIREWLKPASYDQEQSINNNTHGCYPISVDDIHSKKTRASHASLSKHQKYVTCGWPSSVSIPSSAPPQFRVDQQSSEVSMFSNCKSVKVVSHAIQAPNSDTGRVLGKLHSKVGFQTPAPDKFSNGFDLIRILDTNKLIHEVESWIFGREIPGPVQVERAKSILMDQERYLLKALAKLGDLSDDSSTYHLLHQNPHHELQGNELGITAHNTFYAQTSRFPGYPSQVLSQTQMSTLHDYPSRSFVLDRSLRAKLPCNY